MIGESTKALIFIRASILLLRSIAPLSFLYWALLLLYLPFQFTSSSSLDVGLFHWTSTSVPVWILRIFTGNEIWFYLWSTAKTKEFQKHSDYNPGLSDVHRDELFQQILAGMDDPRKFISGWFMGASPEEVYRENLVEWMLWAFFNQHSRDKYESEESGPTTKVIDRYLGEWERCTGMSVPPGYNPKVKCIRLNSDPVKTVHRPACVYIAVGVIYDFLGWSKYYRLGLRHYIPSSESGHRIIYPYIGLPSRPSNSLLTYWYRPCPALKTGDTEELPIVFLHGIGAGLTIYSDMITKICHENPRSAIYLLEMPPVTMKFTEKLPRKQEYVDAVESVMHANGHTQGLFIGHSLGTVTSSWIVHLKPALCHRIILIDPVCFLLHLPDVAFNFIHRQPRSANQWLYWYFVSNEPGIAWFLGRGFYWFENILWLNELPERCQVNVFLSENDMIVDIPSVFKYLANETIPFNTEKLKRGAKIVRSNKEFDQLTTTLWSGPGMDHAMFLLMEGPSADIVESVHDAVLESRLTASPCNSSVFQGGRVGQII